MLHTMYFADEVRDFGEIDKGQTAKIKEGELELAVRLVDELSHDEFTPGQYEDEYRQRVLAAVEQKVEGQEITAAGPEAPARPGDRPDGRAQGEPRPAAGAGQEAAGQDRPGERSRQGGGARRAKGSGRPEVILG